MGCVGAGRGCGRDGEGGALWCGERWYAVGWGWWVSLGWGRLRAGRLERLERADGSARREGDGNDMAR